mgnify:CR=1 FL=1
MVIGLSPKQHQFKAFEELTPEQFIAVAVEAARQLHWDIRYFDNKGFIAHTKPSIHARGEEVRVKLKTEKAIIKSESMGSQMFDWDVNRKNVESFINKFTEIEQQLTVDEIDELFGYLEPKFVSKPENALAKPRKKQPFKEFLRSFTPTRNYFITPILINLNILIFLLMAIRGVGILFPDSDKLIEWGANYHPLTLGDQWWRLFTAFFLHIGIMHLFINMFVLLFIGLLLEPYLGRVRLLIAYLLTGIFASISSIWYHDIIISAGASGAIFGLYGVFLALLTTKIIDKSARKTLLITIAAFATYNMLFGVQFGIDNAAHIGGLVSGIFIGFALIPSLINPHSRQLKYASNLAIVFIILSLTTLVYETIPRDMVHYQQYMDKFDNMETQALDFYEIKQTAPKEQLLTELKDSGIHYWNKNLQLLEKVDQLNLPDHLASRNNNLIDYCNFRIKCYNLHYKSIEKGTDIFQDSIDYYREKINEIKYALDMPGYW